jgi:hypothetical protein
MTARKSDEGRGNSRPSLSKEHLRCLIEESGISEEAIRARGYRTAATVEEVEALGFEEYQRRAPALVLPVHRINGKQVFHRIRPDDPRTDADKPGKVVKYEQPSGTGVVLDVPPVSRHLVKSPKNRLWIMEGEKKGDSLGSRGEAVVSLLGVWSWKRNSSPIADWDYVPLIGREVFVAFDSDTATNENVRQAESALATYLKTGRYAKVYIVRVPPAADGGKQGVDDFLAAGGSVEDLLHLAEEFDEARSYTKDWPILAKEAYHGLAGEIVRTIEPHTESDPVAVLSGFLASVGSVIGRGAHWKIEGDVHYCKLFLVHVGETSKGRKGTGQGRVDMIMHQVAEDWMTHCRDTGLSSGEGLVHRLRDRVERENKKTGETEVVDEGVSDKRLMIEEPEFGSPLTVMRREGNTLSSVLRHAWDDKLLSTLTKNSSERASFTHISFIGHVTKGELLRHLTETKLGGGIANRFLFFLVRRSKLLPLGGKLNPVGADLVNRVREAIEFGYEWREISLSAEREEAYGLSAEELWSNIYPQLSEGKPGLFGSVVSRAEAQVRRMATVYAVLDLSEVITVDHLLAALALWSYSERSSYLVFGDKLGDELADELYSVLVDAGDEGMTRTEISELFGRNQNKVRIGAILRQLEEYGMARRETVKGDGPGRPTEVWYAVA